MAAVSVSKTEAHSDLSVVELDNVPLAECCLVNGFYKENRLMLPYFFQLTKTSDVKIRSQTVRSPVKVAKF